MSDTILFGKKVLTARDKAMLMYVGNAIAICIGGAMMALDESEWNSWWWMKRTGWWLLLLGNVFNTMKAFYSESSGKADKQ